MDSEVLSQSKSVYDRVTASIVAAIERGAGSFVMPWHGGSAGIDIPVNAQTGAPYRGVNVVALWAEAFSRGYNCGTWATYRQWASLGAQVRKGERSSTIVFYKRVSAREAEEEERGERLIARASSVFNAAQVDGWEAAALSPSPLGERLIAVEAVIAGTGAVIENGGHIACYVLADDVVRVPPFERFCGSPTCSRTEAYYSTVLHELAHWTGAPHRLARAFGKRFGDEAYAFEELVAELSAAFLCAELGISNEPRPDHAAYLAGWLRVLGRDTRAIFSAARLAQEASLYVRTGPPAY